MLSFYDIIVAVAYFILMVAVAVVFKLMNKSTSNYFRGGSMLWWLVGATTFMSFISFVLSLSQK